MVDTNKSAHKYSNYATDELQDIIDMNEDIPVSPKNKRDYDLNYDINNECKDDLNEKNKKFFKEVCGGISNQKQSNKTIQKQKEC
jgi:hypothetical protein